MYGEKIRELRMRMNLSQQGLGEKLGVTSVAVSKWENGLSQPDIGTLARLADIFGVSLDELCCRDTPYNPELNFAVMTRAFVRLTPEEQAKYLAVGRTLFAHAFDREGKE